MRPTRKAIFSRTPSDPKGLVLLSILCCSEESSVAAGEDIENFIGEFERVRAARGKPRLYAAPPVLSFAP